MPAANAVLQMSGVNQRGSTAVASISTLARGSSNPATTSKVIAGKCRPITLR